MKQITKITCSGLARAMVCAGYSHLDLPKWSNNEKAKEGDAAGEYLQHLLTGKQVGDTASNGVYFDDDIKFYTKSVSDDIRPRVNSPIECERTINWETRSGIWIVGRPDIDFVDRDGTLCIEDLKYGQGIHEVKENWQLLAYAIGSVILRGKSFNNISLKIQQPRPHHEDGPVREWLITYAELLEYKEKIEQRMLQIAGGNRELQTSSKCSYCMGSAEACPAFSRLFYRALEVSTEFYQDSITNEELSRQLDQIKRADEVIKIKKDSLTELGSQRIKEGGIVPGYVQEKTYGNRSWKKGISPDAIKMMSGYDVIENKFMTPAKAEKLGVSKELTGAMTEKRFTGVKLKKKDTTEIGNKIFGNTTPHGGN